MEEPKNLENRQLSFRLTDEYVAKFDQIHEELASTTKPETFRKIVDAFLNPVVRKIEDPQKMQQLHESIENVDKLQIFKHLNICPIIYIMLNRITPSYFKLN